MPKLTGGHIKDFVTFARAKQYESTAALFASWREWLHDTYGDRCVVIDGKIYPPESQPAATFRGSILWKGDTAAERRAIMRGESVEVEPERDKATEAAIAQFHALRQRLQKAS
jgi:hypothetical protein